MSDDKQSNKAVEAVMQAIQDGLVFQEWMHPDWLKKAKGPVTIEGKFTVVTNVSAQIPPPAAPVDEPQETRKPLYFERGLGGYSPVYEDPKPPGRSFKV